MVSEPQRSIPDDGPVAVEEKPRRRRFRWEIVIGPIISAVLKIGWEMVRDLMLKK